MSSVRVLLVMAVGAFTGFLGGAFGKGGSAIATPLLHLVGVSSFSALASPLPATIPATMIAASAYHRAGHVDRVVLRTILVVGVPATAAGAVMTTWLGGGPLIIACDLVVALLGARMLAHRRQPATVTVGGPALPEAAPARAGRRGDAAPARAGRRGDAAPARGRRRGDAAPARGGVDARPAPIAPGPVVAVGIAVGLVSGLLGNSGGFMLAPLFVTVLGMPLKRALGTSLAAAAVLAVPGTVVHAALGHIDWSITLSFGLASIPLSALGARVALRTAPQRLEVVYGAMLLLIGGGLLLAR